MEFEVLSVETKRGTTKYIKFGKGDKNFIILPGITLIPLHKFPIGTVNAFKDFADEYTFYIFDRKDNIPELYAVEEMTLDVLECIKKLKIKDIYLYGASQGGMMALNLAVKAPSLIRKMVVASASYYANTSYCDFLKNVYSFIENKDYTNMIDYYIRKVYSKEYLDKYLNPLTKFYSTFEDSDLLQFISTLNYNDNFSILNELKKTEVKMMVVASKNDEVYGYEPTLQIAANVKNCKCVIYDEFAHGVYDEAPDFKDRVRNFFNE